MPEENSAGETEHLYQTLKEVVVGLDRNEDGEIDIDEFSAAYHKLNPSATDESMKCVFQKIDKDESKSITLDELAMHYGMTLGEDGRHCLDTAKLKTDDQVLELFQLKSIASELDQEAVAKDIARMGYVRKEAHAITVEKKANESRRASMHHAMHSELSGAQRLRRRNSKTQTAAQLNAILKFPTVQRHATTAEFEFLDACCIGDYETVDRLIEGGIKVNVCDDKGQSALHRVCRIGGPHAVAVCVSMGKRGVELDYQDKNGKTGLHYAAEYGHDDLVEWLIAKGADPTIQSLDGWTPLHEACFKGARRCVELLTVCPNKPNINEADLHGRTALHVASYRCDRDIVEYLYAPY